MIFDRLFSPAAVLFAILLGIILVVPASSAVTLSFDYSLDTGNFFASGSEAWASHEAAGDFFEHILLDDLDAITPSGINTWEARFTNPSTGVDYVESDLYVPADTMIIYVGSRNLDGTTLGQGGPGGYWSYGSTSWNDTVSTRGEGVTQNPGATDFGPWGGALSLDSDSTWHYNHQTTPSFGENDLYSVILHELGHVLGIGTAHSWNNLIAGGEFTGTESVDEYGGNVPLSGSAHWNYSTMSGTFPADASQEAAMDPDITQGTRKVMTYLDVAGLDDLGWDVSPPFPGDANGDWSVDVIDLGALATNYGTIGGAVWGDGDFSDDGNVDVVDLGLLATNYGTTAAAQAVPEPSTLAGLLGLWLAGLMVSLRRRR
ncbi:MAG: matrixin family metalloprotease [Planctomycetota bacterium]|nr:matrixin family metalloprotease [Planctomycetota bacterium]